MNAIGIALLWCIVQITLLGLVAGGLYLLLRRLRPAAAAPLVLTALALVVLLSLMALSPWPRWIRISPLPLGEGPGVRAGQLASAGPLAGEGPGVRVDGLDNTASMVRRPEPDAGNAETVSPESPPAVFGILWKTIADELTKPPAARQDARTWPAVVAGVLLSAMACGLGWLALGMLAVHRQRRRSRPVLGRELLELVDVLRAELRCLRPVAVRQCDDLVTAATIGWRRPVVLLSSDWPTWTSQQLRAVLAHEIAHARSQDFPALLFGQLGVMLHLYHPLMHWLMDRLRLEQELAADALAAGVTGGQREYLTSIAELALHSQDRPMSWPARTFLPTHTTFLRRIAMLRESTVRFVPLSAAARLAVIGVVLLCGLLTAGIRGPGTQAQVLAADAEKPATQASSAAKATPPSANILANPDAEQGEDYAEHWTQGQPIDGVKYIWDKHVAAEGRASLCIEKTVNNYLPIAAWSQTVKRAGDLPMLEVSAQVKAKKMYKAVLDVTFLDESDQPILHKWVAYIGAKKEDDPPANHDWKKYSGTVEIPERTAKLCIALQDYGPGTVWFDDVQARFAAATSDASVDQAEVVAGPDVNGKTRELKYDSGKTGGKRSFGGTGEMIRFTQPAETGTIKGIRIHGSRYGLPQPPAEDFLIYVLSKDRSQVLFTESAPYKLFQRGREKWVNVKFKKPHKVPKTFWIVLDFKAHQTKGVYVSYSGSYSGEGGQRSKVGLPSQETNDFTDGDWMIRVLLADEATSASEK